MPGLPTLSQVRAASWEHLRTNATAWRNLARTWESAFTEVNNSSLRPGGTDWTGAGAEAFQDRAYRDLVKVRGPADIAEKAAGIAERGADAQDGNKRSVLDAVDEAERDNFQVGEDYTVTDTITWYSSAAELEQRDLEAERHSDFIKSQVHKLAGDEYDIARNLSTATAGLHEFGFGDEGADGGAGGDTAPANNRFPLSPPDALPPPRLPGTNDDPWKHGGDQRWSSQTSARPKEIAVLAAAEEEMTRNQQPAARGMLEHYLGNTGAPKQLPPELLDSWLLDGKNGYGDRFLSPPQQITGNINNVTQQAYEEARRTGTAVTLSGTTDWQTVAGSDGDHVRTLGHYSLSTAYNLTMNPDGTYALSYRNDVYDWYNFATHPYASGTTQQISSWAHDLQAAGLAQDFLITGSSSVHTVEGAVR
jgi:hypothetical protein